jgi:hypothetical protein
MIQRQMSENILKLEFRARKIEEMRPKLRPGVKVIAAFYEDQEEYEAEILSELRHVDGFRVVFTEYGNEQVASLPCTPPLLIPAPCQ